MESSLRSVLGGNLWTYLKGLGSSKILRFVQYLAIESTAATALVALILFLAYKFLRNRHIEVVYKDSAANRLIHQTLKPLIDSYSPTFYVPTAFIKGLITNGRKVSDANADKAFRHLSKGRTEVA